MKRSIGFAGIALFLSMIFSACSSSENFTVKQQHVGNSAAPSWVWEPEYYTHKAGKYQFTQGYYRPVINRKQHIKRSLKGFMYKDKTTYKEKS
jgi:hypothetical protein